MNELQQKLDSREVAEMVGKAHNKLMRDIRDYIDQLGESKIGHTDFFSLMCTLLMLHLKTC